MPPGMERRMLTKHPFQDVFCYFDRMFFYFELMKLIFL